MSCILYYSKYCEISKKYIQVLSKSQSQNKIHFICIDKRIKDENNKTYIVLENGQKIILPESYLKFFSFSQWNFKLGGFFEEF